MYNGSYIPDVPSYEKWNIKNVKPNESCMGFSPIRDRHFQLITCGGSLVHQYIVKQIMAYMHGADNVCEMCAQEMADTLGYNKFTIRNAIHDLRNANVIRNMQKRKGRDPQWLLTPAAFHAYHTLQLPRLCLAMPNMEKSPATYVEVRGQRYGWWKLFPRLVPELTGLTNHVIRTNVTSNVRNKLWDFILAQELQA